MLEREKKKLIDQLLSFDTKKGGKYFNRTELILAKIKLIQAEINKKSRLEPGSTKLKNKYNGKFRRKK